MQPHDKISAYVTVVCGQIRWKKAHARVAEEMKDHIADQRDSFVVKGMDEGEATDRAIAETGDAAMIGVQLDRVHRPKPQWGMLAATAVLLLLGLIVQNMIFGGEGTVGIPARRLVFTVLGIVCMLGAYFVDYSILAKFPKTACLSVTALVIATIYFSPHIHGASLHPQHIALMFPLVFAALVFAARRKRYKGIVMCQLIYFAIACVLLAAPTKSGFWVFFISAFALLIAAVWKNWFGVKKLSGFLSVTLPAAGFAIVLVATAGSYVVDRFLSGIDPSRDPEGAGYMGAMIRSMIGGAKWLGQGHIPEQYTHTSIYAGDAFRADMLLTGLISFYGWIAFAVVVAVLFFFVIRGFMLCHRQKSDLGFFVSFSVLMTLVLQAALYVVNNLGFLLISPISLPLISSGNAAMVINLLLVGFMLSAFRAGGTLPGRPQGERRRGGRSLR